MDGATVSTPVAPVMMRRSWRKGVPSSRTSPTRDFDLFDNPVEDGGGNPPTRDVDLFDTPVEKGGDNSPKETTIDLTAFEVFDNPTLTHVTEFGQGYTESTAQLALEARAIDSITDDVVNEVMAIADENKRRMRLIQLLEADEKEKEELAMEASAPIPHYYEWCIVCSNLEKGGAILRGDEAGKPEDMVIELIEKLRKMGLEVSGSPSPNMNEYLISVSAYEAHLMFWATRMGLPMRLRSLDMAHKSGRKFADFAGMVPFKTAKKDEFFVNHFGHHQNSIFNSGERQRIVKYMLENSVDGIDLDASADAETDYHKAGFASMLTAAADAVDQKTGITSMLTAAADAVAQAAPVSSLHRAGNSPSKSGERARHTQRFWPCIEEYFPLHDEHELEWLVQTWAHPKLVIQRVSAEASNFLADTEESKKFTGFNTKNLTKQPIDDIRNYFGSQIAMYFAFVRVYTDQLLWPTLFGVITMGGHIRNGVEGNPLSLPYSVYISFWAVSLISTWRRRQNDLMFLWGTDKFKETEPERKQYRRAKDEVDLVQDPITGKWVLERKNPKRYFMKVAAGWLTASIFVAVVLVAVVLAEVVRRHDDPTELGRFAKYYGSCFNAAAIVVIGSVYDRVAVKLTDWEIHRHQTDHEDALIKKTFLFQAANNYLNLFFIAILKQGSVFGREITCEVIAIKCDPDDEALDEACTEDGSMDVVSCMTELQLQLLIICAAKQFLLKFVSVGRPVLTALAQAKARELEVAISRKAYDDAHKGVAEDVSRHGAAKQLTSRHANHQFEMDDYEGVYMDYNELAVQFGYSTLFAVAFPLAPMLCLVSNLIEQRTDAFKLCRAVRRPEFVDRADIGVWDGVFDGIGVVAVLTNSMLVAFVGSQISTALSVTASSRETRYGDYRHWVAAVAIEHTVLFFRFFLKNIIGENPNWIRDAREQLEKSIKQRMQVRKLF